MIAKRSNINGAMVLKVIGWLLIIEAILMSFPMIVSFGYQELKAAKSFLFAIVITAGIGCLMTTFIHPNNTNMHKKEGFLLTALIWVLFSAFGMLPYLFTGAIDNTTDAFFETISGFTTTGATVCPNVEILPKGILFWRSFSQWIGGMGIILFTLAVIPMLNHQGGIQLFNAEISGITHDKLRPRISQTAKSLWMVYIVLTLMLIALLWAGPMNLFDAVCQALSAVSTGGFSTSNSSIYGWHSDYVTIMIVIFMFLGGTNFSLLYMTAHGKPKKLLNNDIFRWYVGIILTATILCYVNLKFVNPKAASSDGFLNCLFQVISGLTSTGYLVTNFENWGQFAVMILTLLMLSCACAGSTTGAVKIDRIVVLIKNVRNEFYQLLHPNLVTSVRIDNRVIPYEVVEKIIAFISIYVIIIVINATIITIYGINCFDAMFMSLSALGNVGFGYGVTSGGLYNTLPVLIKWLLCFDMLIGRLELFTVLILLTKGFWTK